MVKAASPENVLASGARFAVARLGVVPPRVGRGPSFRRRRQVHHLQRHQLIEGPDRRAPARG
jgi:hypothetical protein